jgi:hypothetical protein
MEGKKLMFSALTVWQHTSKNFYFFKSNVICNGSPYHTVMLQKGCFAASTLVVTHQQAQFNKMKSK